MALLFTTHKQSLGQGNVFTGVCPQVGGDWYPSMHHRSHDQHLVGSASRVVLPPGRSAWGGCRADPSELEKRVVGILLECFFVVCIVSL